MKIKLLLLLCCGLWSSCNSYDYCPVTPSESDLVFTELARSWDEAMPLGNATVGALVWQRDSTLRLSLDRTDLWDLRPVDSLSGDNFRFSWVKEHIRQKNYLPVQKKLDWPYDMNPAVQDSRSCHRISIRADRHSDSGKTLPEQCLM